MNKKILDEYVSEGWLASQKHPTLPLEIYNYTQKTQYEGKWDSVTLSCRGLIIDSITGEVIIKPFEKFFNYEEVPEEIPWETSEYVYVQEKMDGSFGILFNYRGNWIVATRGSFTSAQAIRGLEIAKRKYDLSKFMSSIAYLIEIIYPENRVVVSYDQETIVFLGASLNLHYPYDENELSEFNWQTSKVIFAASEIQREDIVESRMVERGKSGFGKGLFEELKSLNIKNKEGFVLRFYPSNYRCKIKFEDYIALHKIVTQVSSYDIWESLRTTGSLPESFLEKVPDEFYDWVKKTEGDILDEFRFIKSLHFAQFSSIKKSGASERKEFAMAFTAIKDFRINSGVLFQILDGKDIDTKIWEMVKPKYSRPFENKINIK
jgi:RNA ligase